LQYRLRNEPKSIKIIAKPSSKNIFRWIFTYLYFAFDNVFLNKNTWKKTLKNVKTNDYYIYGLCSTSLFCNHVYYIDGVLPSALDWTYKMMIAGLIFITRNVNEKPPYVVS